MTRTVVGLVFLGLTIVSGYFYYVQYFKWRACFNELGRCFDTTSGVVYLEQAGVGWLSLSVLALGVFLYQVWKLSQSRRKVGLEGK